MIAVTELVPVLAEHLGPVAGVRAAADAARQLVKIHRLAVRENSRSFFVLPICSCHLTMEEKLSPSPCTTENSVFCSPSAAISGLAPYRVHMLTRARYLQTCQNVIVSSCQHQSAGISPPDGHLHVVLDDDEHLVVPPAPGPPPRRHDAAVPPRRQHPLFTVAELEIPDHVFVKIFSKYDCKIIVKFVDIEIVNCLLLKFLHLPSLVDVFFKK